MTPPRPSSVLVLGVGNILWADEGFGVRCVERFAARFEASDAVTLMDGGTQGLLLIASLRDHDRVLIFDAVDFGGEPGELSVVRDAAIPAFVGARAVSLHQTGMQEVLALAGLLGWRPSAVTLIGVQPVVLEDYGGSLTDIVRHRLDEALDVGAAELAGWGVKLRRRKRAARGDEAQEVLAGALALASYEAGRPSAENACRIGDERVLARTPAS
jgi:hydrogenase maturation protease